MRTGPQNFTLSLPSLFYLTSVRSGLLLSRINSGWFCFMKISVACLTLLLWCSAVAHAQFLSFRNGDDILHGQYLPALTQEDARAVLIFVHGDGATPYDAEGYYELLWQPLREAGYAIFSWDKPGVGRSTGDWLNQSMSDRQGETRAAILAVQNYFNFSADRTGVIGFSQAGWVVPALADDASLMGFAVGIGFARNWIEQGHYYSLMKNALMKKGDVINPEQYLATREQEIDFLRTRPSYQEYLAFEQGEPMSEARYRFVLTNFEADSTDDFRHLAVPFLLMWGEDDLHVDARTEYEFFRQHLPESGGAALTLISGGQHGMLRSDIVDSQNISLFQWLSVVFYQQEAFAPSFLPELIQWLNQQQR